MPQRSRFPQTLTRPTGTLSWGERAYIKSRPHWVCPAVHYCFGAGGVAVLAGGGLSPVCLIVFLSVTVVDPPGVLTSVWSLTVDVSPQPVIASESARSPVPVRAVMSFFMFVSRPL